MEELSELKSMAALCQDKMQFSMVTKEVDQYLESNNHIKSIALFGIESHVCVLQTALDLRKRSLDVYLITDGISSSDAREIPVALEVIT